MNDSNSILGARITYFFKETFRAHSKDEYREFLTRGLGESKHGITGTYPWLYVRAFFILFILFTVNTIILRTTRNTLYVPTVTLIGGMTFTIPFTIFLFELYPKRDLSILKLFAILILGGTAAGLFAQLGYSLIKVENGLYSALVSGLVEEISKAFTAIAAIAVMKNKNSYACFLIAASVGAGFSVIEDMGYIFYYSDMGAARYGDIRDMVYLFIERGFSSLCTHILWSGIIGLSYGADRKKFGILFLLVGMCSVFIHACWNLPLGGWQHALVIAFCTIVTVIANIISVYAALKSAAKGEYDESYINDNIILEAKKMGERMRFTNAANLTFALTCTLLAAISLALCSLPIGMEKMRVYFASKEEFILNVQGDYNLKIDLDRTYNPNGKNVEERFIFDDKELILAYVTQEVEFEGYDGVYYYGYYIDSDGVADEKADAVYLELDDITSRIPCVEYKFGEESVWIFEVNTGYSDYSYNSSNGVVSTLTEAEEFGGYNLLIALVASAVAVVGACCVILTAFTIKLRRVNDE